MASRTQRSRRASNPTASLFFSGKGSETLPEYVTKEDIRGVFSEFDVKRVVIFHGKARKSLGKGFITFTSVEVATNALTCCRNRRIDSVPIYLNYFRERSSASKDSQSLETEPASPGSGVTAGKRTSKKSFHSGTASETPFRYSKPKHKRRVEYYKLFVSSMSGKLPETVREDGLAEHFRGIVGTPAHSVTLPCDPNTHCSLGFCHVQYCDRRTAVEARVKADGTKLSRKYALYVQLESPLDHLEFAALRCTEQELVYLRHYFHDKQTFLFGKCSVDVVEKSGSLIICAQHNDLEPAEQSIKDSLLQGFVCCQVTLYCDVECVSLMQNLVLQYSKEPEITCIVQEQKAAKDPRKSAVKVFVCGHHGDTISFQATTSCIKKLKLEYKVFPLPPEATGPLNSIEQDLELLAQRHGTAIRLIKKQCNSVLRVYGLRSKDISDAWKAIKSKVDSTTITETVSLTLFQLKFLQATFIDKIRVVADIAISDSPKAAQKKPAEQQLSITGELGDIVELVNELKEAASKCTEEHIQISCSPKRLLPWKKRWDKFVKDQCSQKGMFVDYCIDTAENEGATPCKCTVLFGICGDNGAAVQEVKDTIVNVENGQAFTEHVMMISSREAEYIQRNNSAIVELLQQAHNVFIVLQSSDKRSVSILVASYLDTVKVQQIECWLSKHFQDFTSRKLRIVDSVAGAILLSEKLPEIEKCHRKVAFAFPKPTDYCMFEIQGLVADINAAETHIEKELAAIKSNIVKTDQLMLKKTSFPLLSSSSVPCLEGHQLLSCSYPTISHREALLGVKCIQTATGHIVTIELCDPSVQQSACNPDAILCLKDAASINITDSCAKSECMTVTYLPELLDPDTNITTSKCEIHVSVESPSLSEALLNGLNSIHPRKYEVVMVTFHEASSDLLVAVLNSIGQYAMLCPDTAVHTVQVVMTPPLMQIKNKFKHYSFSKSNPTIPSPGKTSGTQPTKPRWYWEEHGKYFEYDQDANDQINSAWACDKQGKCHLVINYQVYLINLKSMTQTNVATQFSRPIQCRQVDQSSSELCGSESSAPIQWSYCDDSGNFSCYTPLQSQQIEDMYSCSTPVTTLSINDWEYAFDFDRMVQINTKTERERQIKRQKAKQTDIHQVTRLKTLDPSETVVLSLRGYPSSIESVKECLSETVDSLVKSEEIAVPPQLSVDAVFFQQIEEIIIDLKYIEHTVVTRDSASLADSQKFIHILGEKELLKEAHHQLQTKIISYLSSGQVPNEPIKYPSEWEPQQKSFQIFSVKNHSNEWKRIASLFNKTMSNVKIIEIRRIQNKVLWEKYMQDKKRICEKNKGSANEKELFHGSRSTKAEDIVSCEDGLDMRWSAEGMWGRANYFAVKACYSDSFAYQRSDGLKEMIVAKVLTGDSHTSPPNSSLRMPPEKPSANSGGLKLKYDTINGVTKGSRVYMTYSNEKAYPGYIIIYQHIADMHASQGWQVFNPPPPQPTTSIQRRQAPNPPPPQPTTSSQRWQAPNPPPPQPTTSSQRRQAPNPPPPQPTTSSQRRQTFNPLPTKPPSSQPPPANKGCAVM